MLLTFEINKQTIIRTDSEHPVADSRNYLFAKFDFITPEWDRLIKSVVFWKGDKAYTCILNEDNTCEVPQIVISPGCFYVSCFAGDLITNDKARVVVKKSGYAKGITPPEPESDIYHEILSMYSEIKRIAQSVRDDADAGMFNGHAGSQGEDGATFTPIISEEGNLSWTNDKGLNNPETINIKNRQGLNFFTVTSNEEFENVVYKLTEDFSSNSPCFILSSYNGAETSGLDLGQGLIIIDSGTGNMEDAYVFPYYTNESTFTHNDKRTIEDASNFINIYSDNTSWRSIKIGDTLGTTKYADGTSFKSSPLKQIIAQFQISYAGIAHLMSCDLTGLDGSPGFTIPEEFRIDGLEITSNVHLFITDNSYIFRIQFIADGIYKDVTVIKNNTNSLFNKNKWTLFHLNTKHRIIYLYGRS